MLHTCLEKKIQKEDCCFFLIEVNEFFHLDINVISKTLLSKYVESLMIINLLLYLDRYDKHVDFKED